MIRMLEAEDNKMIGLKNKADVYNWYTMYYSKNKRQFDKWFEAARKSGAIKQFNTRLMPYKYYLYPDEILGVIEYDGTPFGSKEDNYSESFTRSNRKRSNRMNESSRYRNIVNDKNKRSVRKAVDIINKFIDDEAVFLPDVLDRNSDTYWAIKEYVGSDWNLDDDAIINDWELDQSQDHEYDLNPGGYDPRPYLFDVLVYVVGYDYDEAERILNI